MSSSFFFLHVSMFCEARSHCECTLVAPSVTAQDHICEHGCSGISSNDPGSLQSCVSRPERMSKIG